MAYRSELAEQVRIVFDEEFPAAIEKKMFGGIGFMIQGNLACGILEDGIVVRVGKELYEEQLQLPHTRKFDFTGKALTGWVVVNEDGLETKEELRDWVLKGLDFALSLPPK